jgi:hypothetical protein
MISEALATRQVMRLSVFNTFPQKAEGQEELIKALQSHAVNDTHAVRIIDAWLNESKFSPTPADIRRTSDGVSVLEDRAERDAACLGCKGTGFEFVWTLHTSETIRLTQGQDSGGEEQIVTHQRMDFITEAVYHDLRGKVDGQKQRVYSNARHCSQCGYGRQLAMARSTREAA